MHVLLLLLVTQLMSTYAPAHHYSPLSGLQMLQHTNDDLLPAAHMQCVDVLCKLTSKPWS
jgi:hypothetical protein